MLRDFNLENMQHVRDGRAAIAWNQKVRAAILDCIDRPGEKAARTITMTLNLVPVMDQRGEFERLIGQVEFSGKTPKQKTNDFDIGVRTDGSAYFNDSAPDNANQRTLDEQAPEAWSEEEETE